MIIRFNKAQLSREQRESLERVLAVMQVENKSEIDVSIVEFPVKFMVKVDNDVEVIVLWDDAAKLYKLFLDEVTSEPEPEPKPESKPELTAVVDPKTLARLKYELMSTHLNMSVEKKVIFNKEYARLWSEHNSYSDLR